MGGIVQGWRNDTCTGKSISTEDPMFPLASPMNYICGAVPEQGTAIGAERPQHHQHANHASSSASAALNGTPNFIFDNIVNAPMPAVLDVPGIDHIGLVRNVTRFSVASTYEFGGGYVATFQAGSNELKANWIRSFGLTPLGYLVVAGSAGFQGRELRVSRCIADGRQVELARRRQFLRPDFPAIGIGW